jgi:hypothetical protein
MKTGAPVDPGNPDELVARWEQLRAAVRAIPLDRLPEQIPLCVKMVEIAERLSARLRRIRARGDARYRAWVIAELGVPPED